MLDLCSCAHGEAVSLSKYRALISQSIYHVNAGRELCIVQLTSIPDSENLALPALGLLGLAAAPNAICGSLCGFAPSLEPRL